MGKARLKIKDVFLFLKNFFRVKKKFAHHLKQNMCQPREEKAQCVQSLHVTERDGTRQRECALGNVVSGYLRTQT